MSHRPSGFQLRPSSSRVFDARTSLAHLYLKVEEMRADMPIDLVHAVRTLWLSVVYDLAEIQEESPRWPTVDYEEDLARIAQRAASRYEAFIAPLLDHDLAGSSAYVGVALREAIGNVIDALDPAVDSDADVDSSVTSSVA